MKPATLEASNILLPYKLPIQSFAPLIQSIVCLDAAPRGFSRGVVVDFWWLWLYNREKRVECEVLLTEVGEDDAGGNQYFHTATQRW